MNSYSCPALNPSLCQFLEPLILVLCFSLCLSACYSWHIVTFPRWRLIYETSLSTPHIWSLFTGQRGSWSPPPPPHPTDWLGWSQQQDQVPVDDTSFSAGGQVCQDQEAGLEQHLNTQIHKLNSHPFHGRYGLCVVSDPSHVACCHSVKNQLILIFPHCFLKPSDYSYTIPYITLIDSISWLHR